MIATHSKLLICHCSRPVRKYGYRGGLRCRVQSCAELIGLPLSRASSASGAAPKQLSQSELNLITQPAHSPGGRAHHSMSSYRSLVESPLGRVTDAEQDEPRTTSIRTGVDAELAVPDLSEHDDDSDNFNRTISIHVNQPVGSMSISEYYSPPALSLER